MPEPEQDKDALIAQLRDGNQQLKAENELLREKIDLLARKIYGASSEKLDPGQLELLLNPDAAKKPDAADCAPHAPAAEKKGNTKRATRRNRPRLPENIEVIEEVINPEDVDPENASWYDLDEEVSERLEYEPQRFKLRRIIRRTWVKRGDPDAVPLTAPLPPCLLEGSLLTPSLAAHLITSKFSDHLPFYRQEQILDHRHGIGIGRNTMCHWAGVSAQWLEPLYKLMAEDLRQQDWLGVDETPIDYLSPGHGRTKQGYLWTYRHPEVGVLYDWHTGRSHQCLDRILTAPLTGEDFQGILLTDGFGAYETWRRKHDGITLAACWAHVRRKFFEATPHHPQQAVPILENIDALFAIERKLRRQRAGPDEVLRARQQQARPLLETIKTQLTTLDHCLPKSTLGKARTYTLGLWSRLLTFLDHPEIPIDNNGVENAIRPTKLGSKNWLFIGSADTGQRSAILYTMVESIRQNGGDAFAYLQDVLARLPAMTNQDDLRPLLPLNWLASRRAEQNASSAA